MFSGFEVRIWKAQENLSKLSFLEEVWEKFHRVGTQTGDILVEAAVRVLIPQCFDPVLNKLGHLGPDLHAYLAISNTPG